MLATWQEAQTCDMHREMMVLTLRIAIKTLFNVDADRDVELMLSLSNKLIGMFELQESPLWLAHNYLPTPANRRFSRGIKGLDQFIYSIIGQRRQNSEDTGDLLSM